MPEAYTYIDNEFVKTKDAKISILEPTFTKSDAVYDTEHHDEGGGRH